LGLKAGTVFCGTTGTRMLVGGTMPLPGSEMAISGIPPLPGTIPIPLVGAVGWDGTSDGLPPPAGSPGTTGIEGIAGMPEVGSPGAPDGWVNAGRLAAPPAGRPAGRFEPLGMFGRPPPEGRVAPLGKPGTEPPGRSDAGLDEPEG